MVWGRRLFPALYSEHLVCVALFFRADFGIQAFIWHTYYRGVNISRE